MMMRNLVIISGLCYVAILVSESKTTLAEETLHRYRRQLLYPNSTLFQVNIGVGTPTPIKTINVNWAIQANFQLPWNRTQVPVDILYANGGYDGLSRKRRDDGLYESDAKLYHFYKYAEDALNRVSILPLRSRFFLRVTEPVTRAPRWSALAESAGLAVPRLRSTSILLGINLPGRSFGHNGTGCVLKTLCQLGAEPLHTEREDDLLHEIFTFILNPSNDVAEHPCQEASPYIEAFRKGQNHRDCSRMFHCTSVSLLDLFTKTFDTP